MNKYITEPCKKCNGILQLATKNRFAKVHKMLCPNCLEGYTPNEEGKQILELIQRFYPRL